jgi:hypothetical protein
LPDAVDTAAERGTQEHALAEACLRTGTLPTIACSEDNLDTRPQGAAATRYIETIAADIAHAQQIEFLLVEEVLDARRLHSMLFGTLDAALLWRDHKNRLRLNVYDLKSGAYKVAPSALQFSLYAGLLLVDPRTRDALANVWLINTIVVQPHATTTRTNSNGGVSRAQHTHLSILRTTFEYLTLARAATGAFADELPLIPGSHCLFCPARIACPVRREKRDAALLAQLQSDPRELETALQDLVSP